MQKIFYDIRTRKNTCRNKDIQPPPSKFNGMTTETLK